ncbi:MAG: hypothetical protein HZA81_01740 [Candidatus Taylorbacteria bacterium]|nr:hypothetical protein [Candidatus Taylorbacteria bacterium]
MFLAKESSRPYLLAAAAAAVLAALGFFAYFVYAERAALVQAPVSTDRAATSTMVIPFAAIPTTRAADRANEEVVSPKSIAASAPDLSPQAGTQGAGAHDPLGRFCTANDLTGRASWEKEGPYLSGSVRIRNSSGSDCVVSESSSIAITSGSRVVAYLQASRPETGFVLPQGEERRVGIDWSNWCGGALSEPAFVFFALPGEAGYLRVPLISSLGSPQYDAPPCGSPASPSILDLRW